MKSNDFESVLILAENISIAYDYLDALSEQERTQSYRGLAQQMHEDTYCQSIMSHGKIDEFVRYLGAAFEDAQKRSKSERKGYFAERLLDFLIP